jgi:hypothetical protein
MKAVDSLLSSSPMTGLTLLRLPITSLEPPFAPDKKCKDQCNGGSAKDEITHAKPPSSHISLHHEFLPKSIQKPRR